MPDSFDLNSYSVFAPADPFEDHSGPFYYRVEGKAAAAGDVRCALPTHAAHANYAGGVHGGVLLTFADYALCLVAGRAADGGTNSSFAVTVSIAVEFLAPARIGPPLESSGEPLQVTGRLAFARGSITQEGKTVALWSGVIRHVARAKAMGRKAEHASAVAARTAQAVPPGFDLFAKASAYSRHLGPVHVRQETDGASLVQTTEPHMCNSGGALHGGYMMSFADTALTRAAALVTGMQPSTVSFAAEFLSAGTPTTPITTRVEIPRHGKSLAFLRGVLRQDDRALLSYSATMSLRPKA